MNKKTYESGLQAEIVRYMRNERRVPYGTFFSIPNEGKREVRFASRMLAQGLISGMPDLCLLHDKTISFFEVKTTSGSLSKKQRLIHANLKEQGFDVYVIRTFDEFVKYVSLILK